MGTQPLRTIYSMRTSMRRNMMMKWTETYEQVEPRDTVGEQNDLGDDDELADPAPEEAETDPITDAAIVAAEDLSDIAAETESDNNEDDFKGTHYIDHE